MTLSSFLDSVKRRHNSESDSFWGDDEIYQLITNRCNEVLPVIGLIEGTDTSNTSTATTQAVAYPSTAAVIRQVNYKSTRLQRISFREWELFKNGTTTTSGLPSMWVPWNREILLVTIPDTTGDAITIYFYGLHPLINNTTQTTIDIPAVLHSHVVIGVLADMFVKDLRLDIATYYENKWNQVSVPAFHRFKSNEDQDGRANRIADSDTDLINNLGII
jgi:hypothetical protein